MIDEEPLAGLVESLRVDEEILTEHAKKLPKASFEALKKLFDGLTSDKAMLLLEQQEQTEQIEELTLSIGKFRAKMLGNRVGFLTLGVGIGAVGGYFLARKLLQTKYEQISQEEIEQMRVHYANKTRAFEAEKRKRPIEEIVAERGYASPERDTTEPPMAVPPPATVLDVEARDSDDDSEMSEDAVEGPEGVKPQTRNVFKDAQPSDYVWDLEKELRRRSPDHPYVIHYDERNDMEAYDDMTLTLYEVDNVVCNARDEVYDMEEREMFLGEANLNRFGHGSGSMDIVYIRNDKLGMVYEVIKSDKAYQEEVAGFQHTDTIRRNVERMRRTERDAQDE